MNFIEIKVSTKDLELLRHLDEVEEKGNSLILQTSAAQYIEFYSQPERSKRKDLDFIKLADEFWNIEIDKNIITSNEEEEGAIKVLESFANWLNCKKRCSEH